MMPKAVRHTIFSFSGKRMIRMTAIKQTLCHGGGGNPKSECRNSKETRMPKSETKNRLFELANSVFELRISFGIRNPEFGFVPNVHFQECLPINKPTAGPSISAWKFVQFRGCAHPCITFKGNLPSSQEKPGAPSDGETCFSRQGDRLQSFPAG